MLQMVMGGCWSIFGLIGSCDLSLGKRIFGGRRTYDVYMKVQGNEMRGA